MKIFTAEKIREADRYTIDNEPIPSVMLMERAAEKLAEWINTKIPKKAQIKIFAGPGNNGGDGWALGRLLVKINYENIELFQLKISENIAHDAEINRKRLLKESKVKVTIIESEKQFPEIGINDYVIDALFGSGLSRPLEGLSLKLVQYINQNKKKYIIAIDMPSGLFAEDNSKNDKHNIIQANYTLTFQFPKISFLFPENQTFVGEYVVLPIGLHSDFIKKEPTDYLYIEEDEVIALIRERNRVSHKGTYGHALLVAGSYGMMGAAVLAARSAYRSGAGLVTAHIPAKGVDIIQTTVPESLVSIDPSDTVFTKVTISEKYSAIGIGPGLGMDKLSVEALKTVLKDSKVPLIIDADALNILSVIPKWQDLIREGSVLTPHPKEFSRLFGDFTDSYTRLSAQRKFSLKKSCTVVYKGANTCITSPDGRVFFNSTGNPGMATGGSGDVLTGLILGLIAQGYIAENAAIIGVYVHGMSGDEVIKEKGYHSLMASDLVDNIGSIFNVLEKKKSTK